MNMKILGNGGALNDGLPYNSFIINEKILIEMPPDVMLSLLRENIDIPAIEQIYISHLHGDHTFGFPFFALRLFKLGTEIRQKKKLKLYIPRHGKDYLIDLTEKAMSVGSPCVDWVVKNIDFKEISLSQAPEIELMDYTAELFKMDHPLETYGFVLKKNSKILFTYTSDTKWSHNIEFILKEKSKIILIDLNGEPGDPSPVHVSEQELIQNGIKLVHPKAVFYGTHLRRFKKSGHPMIRYAEPGMEIEI
ncbi:MAG: ribonuclease Z [Spirochaetes bacterium]|nr:ribonuclease Z [Spirochaetota bacterium]